MGSVLPLLFRLFSAVLFLGFSSMALAYDANVSKVEVTGRAAISDDQTQKARRHALEDALYLAALKAGADISGTAITSKGVLVRDIVKLDAQGRLVDFNIVGENNTGTHYEVKLHAFFAKKRTQSCPKPRYPSVIIMAPRLKVSSNVEAAYTPIADLVAKQITDKLLTAYSGPISKDSQRSLAEVTSSSDKNLLFDYQSLQRGHSEIAGITEDFMLSIDISSRVKNKRLESQVTLALIARDGFKPVSSHEKLFVSKLPTKTPLRSLNVFWPKTLKINEQELSAMVSEVGDHLRLTACNPLEAKTVFSSGELRLGIGSKSGVRKGSLAYITDGSESWTLLEVSNVTQTSATLKPINAMSSPKTLGNQTIRFIEGAM